MKVLVPLPPFHMMSPNGKRSFTTRTPETADENSESEFQNKTNRVYYPLTGCDLCSKRRGRGPFHSQTSQQLGHPLLREHRQKNEALLYTQY